MVILERGKGVAYNDYFGFSFRRSTCWILFFCCDKGMHDRKQISE